MIGLLVPWSMQLDFVTIKDDGLIGIRDGYLSDLRELDD